MTMSQTNPKLHVPLTHVTNKLLYMRYKQAKQKHIKHKTLCFSWDPLIPYRTCLFVARGPWDLLFFGKSQNHD